MSIVDIYLLTEPESTTSTEWIRALSIPRQDIKRLALRPLKWLRFATFAVCGAKGDLSTTKGGEVVDYDEVSLDDLADEYYYTPDGAYHLVDRHALNDECTSSVATPRRAAFREDVCRRDRCCIITGDEPSYCHAAHIIPHSKGSQYITYIVRDRSSLYEQSTFSLKDDIDIDCVENGMLLVTDLHIRYATGGVVFLKTPNFAMSPADVPRVEQGPVPDERTTLQYIKPPVGLDRVLPRDVRADWSHEDAPPTILLDFMYGVAVIRRWACDGLGDMLQRRFEDEFSQVPNDHLKDEPQDLDRDAQKGKQKERKTFSSDAKADMLKAMDHVLMLSMLVRKAPPRSMMEEREKREKEKGALFSRASVDKVRRWLDSDA